MPFHEPDMQLCLAFHHACYSHVFPKVVAYEASLSEAAKAHMAVGKVDNDISWEVLQNAQVGRALDLEYFELDDWKEEGEWEAIGQEVS